MSLLVPVLTNILLTSHWNRGSCTVVGITGMTFKFNPEIKRASITLMKIINHQRTVLRAEVSQQLCPTPVVFRSFRLNGMADDLISLSGLPDPCEFIDRCMWIAVGAGDHHTWTKETFDWGQHISSPRWGFCLSNCNKLHKMWWNEAQKQGNQWEKQSVHAQSATKQSACSLDKWHIIRQTTEYSVLELMRMKNDS